jgi:2-keto-4-pentenoate hydratase/2-oxohepta-3-ene-1,7-dioic acid hydratase in catechol pathway
MRKHPAAAPAAASAAATATAGAPVTQRSPRVGRMSQSIIESHWLTKHLRDHIAELNSARPKQPFFFLKPSTSILLQGEGPVIRPKGVELSYEIELALIMGKDVKDIEESDEAAIFDAIESTSSSCLELSIT